MRKGRIEPVSELVAPTPRRRALGTRITGYVVLPALVGTLAGGVGYLKWRYDESAEADAAAAQSVGVATEATVAMLSYRPDTAERDLNNARDRLTGSFRDDYTKLIDGMVIPGAKQKMVTVQAKVTDAAAVSATAYHAVVLVFVDQTTTIGADPPSDSASSVKVTLDKDRDRWLVSGFDPV